MLVGNTPFHNESEEITIRNIINNKIPKRQSFSSEITDLLKKLLCKNPNERLGSKKGAEELKTHPFFSSINWGTLIENRCVQTYKLIAETQSTFEFENESTNMSLVN